MFDQIGLRATTDGPRVPPKITCVSSRWEVVARVRKFSKEFMGVIDGRERRWPSPFKVFAFAYFAEGHNALDPTLEWYQCTVIYGGDDSTVPERPTH